MLFALGWASGAGLVPVSVGPLWHPQLQRPVVGLRLVRTPGAVAGLGPGVRGMSDIWSWAAGQIPSRGWALGAEWGRGPGGVGRVPTLGGQVGGHPGWFRLVGSAYRIHTCPRWSLRSEMPEKLKVIS